MKPFRDAKRRSNALKSVDQEDAKSINLANRALRKVVAVSRVGRFESGNFLVAGAAL
jgi:hypothetical protein